MSEKNKYKAFVWNSVVKWNEKQPEVRRNAEEKSACFCCSLQYYRKDWRKCSLIVADNVYIYKIGEKLNQEDWNLLHSRFSYPDYIPLRYIGVVCMSHKIGFEEVPLTSDDIKIISILRQSKMTVGSLLSNLCSSNEIQDCNIVVKKRLAEFYNNEIIRLVKRNILYSK